MHVLNKRTDVSYGNPAIQERVLALQRASHIRHVLSAKPCIDTHPPFIASCQQGKDFLLKKRNDAEIARSDLKMIQSIASTMTRPFELPPGPRMKHSKRLSRLEASRINAENQRLLSRLETLQPTIKTKALLSDYERSQRLMVNSSFSLRRQCQKELSKSKEAALLSKVVQEAKQALTGLHAPALHSRATLETPDSEEHAAKFVQASPD